jgi:acylphosphatase
LARGYDVTGYVQNLADGRVYLHAEGDEGEVEAFTDQIAQSLDGHIRGEEIKTFTGLRTCREFAIRR